MPDDVEIRRASPQDTEWCARLMASSEPWLTLGRGYEDCLARCRHPEYDLLVARSGAGPARMPDFRAGIRLLDGDPFRTR